MHGGPEVEAWIASLGLRRIDYGSPNLLKDKAARTYLLK
jgi:hypothetical protein